MPRKPTKTKTLSSEEAIALIQREDKCSRAEAEATLVRFMIERPESWDIKGGEPQ